MKPAFLNQMQDALNLVQSGQLQQATALIQQSLQPQATAPQASATTGRIIEGESRRVSPESAPQQGQFIHKTYRSTHGSRDYKLYLPSQYNAATNQALPLVIMLHGCTQSADDFATGTQMNSLAEEMGFLVAYPSQSQNANMNRCWNWFQPQDQQNGHGEPALIAGLTQSILQDYKADKKRVYIAGLSAGGAMAAIMGATYPDLYAAVGVHSGLAVGSASDLPSALTAMRMGAQSQRPEATSTRFVPTIIFHGDQDHTVAALNGEQVLQQAKQRLAANDEHFHTTRSQQRPAHSRAYTRTQLKNAHGVTQLEHWLIHGAGHAWSGGSTQGSYTDPRGPAASRAMLTFFLAQAAVHSTKPAQ